MFDKLLRDSGPNAEAMRTTPRTLLAPALVGVATGLRSFTGLAALSLLAPAGGGQPDETLRRNWARTLTAGGALLEDVVDKLPKTPSRLEPAGLGGRLAIGAVTGTIVSYRSFSSAPTAGGRVHALAAVVGLAAAGAAAWLGYRGRTWAAGRIGRDFPVALSEDLVAASIAYAATRAAV